MPYFGPQVTKLCDFFANMVLFHVLIGFIMTNSVMEWKLDVIASPVHALCKGPELPLCCFILLRLTLRAGASHTFHIHFLDLLTSVLELFVVIGNRIYLLSEC